MQTQIIEIAVVVLSAAAVALRRHNAVLLLVGFGVTADAVAFRAFGPVMPIHRIIGVFVLLEALTHAPGVFRRHRALMYLAAYLALMAALAVIYGWLFPWDEGSEIREWNQKAGGRSLVSLARQVADVALMVYVARRAMNDRARDSLLLGLAVGLGVSAVVAFVDLATGSRVVALFTGTDVVHTTRQGGLNVEPRALGRAAAFAVMLAIAAPFSRWLKLALVVTGVTCLAVSASTSAIVALGVAVGAYALFGGAATDVRRVVATASAVALVVGVVSVLWEGEVNEDVRDRMETLAWSRDAEPGEPELVARLEVFDRAAARFLLANPEHAIIGTGPDLISLPASPYVAGTARAIYGDRIDSVPHTWLISTMANGGLIGVALMALFATGLVREAKRRNAERGWMGFAVMLFMFSAAVMAPPFWACVGLLVGRLELAGREFREPSRGRFSWRPLTQA